MKAFPADPPVVVRQGIRTDDFGVCITNSLVQVMYLTEAFLGSLHLSRIQGLYYHSASASSYQAPKCKWLPYSASAACITRMAL